MKTVNYDFYENETAKNTLVYMLENENGLSKEEAINKLEKEEMDLYKKTISALANGERKLKDGIEWTIPSKHNGESNTVYENSLHGWIWNFMFHKHIETEYNSDDDTITLYLH